MSGVTPRIVFIPGQNPKPEPAVHSRLLWRCLLEGVRRADVHAYHWLRAQPEIFHLGSWNHLFYADGPEPPPAADALDALLASPVEALPGEEELSSRRRMMLMYTVGDLLPFLVHRVPDPQIKNTLQEALRYFENHLRLADRVRQYLRQTLQDVRRPDSPLMVIGHSLGSVLAFDVLWESSHLYGDAWKVDLFMTLGSPLGSRFVRRRRLGAGLFGRARYPLGIRRWVNVAADGDHIALNRLLGEDYRAMRERGLVEAIVDHCQGVHNPYRDAEGWNPHRSYGYLVHPVTGSEIAGWLRRHATDIGQTPVAHGGDRAHR